MFTAEQIKTLDNVHDKALTDRNSDSHIVRILAKTNVVRTPSMPLTERRTVLADLTSAVKYRAAWIDSSWSNLAEALTEITI